MKMVDFIGPVISACKSFFLELNGLDEQFQVATRMLILRTEQSLLEQSFYLFGKLKHVTHGGLSDRGKNWKAKNYESGDLSAF